MIVGQTARETMKGKNILGYVQKFEVNIFFSIINFKITLIVVIQTFPTFFLSLQCEEQLDALKKIPDEQRFLQVDASGGLVKITKVMNRHYARVRL